MKFLVGKGANIHVEDIYGIEPVHAAAGVCQEIVGFLLSKGASINNADKYGWRPLHFAAKEKALKNLGKRARELGYILVKKDELVEGVS